MCTLTTDYAHSTRHCCSFHLIVILRSHGVLLLVSVYAKHLQISHRHASAVAHTIPRTREIAIREIRIGSNENPIAKIEKKQRRKCGLGTNTRCAYLIYQAMSERHPLRRTATSAIRTHNSLQITHRAGRGARHGGPASSDWVGRGSHTYTRCIRLVGRLVDCDEDRPRRGCCSGC